MSLALSRNTLAIRSRRVVTPDGIQNASVLIDNGGVVDISFGDEVPSGYPVDDVGDLVVMPGLVDTHVHVNQPGRTEWEGFETATRAAAAGGITTLVDMPLNNSPVTTTVDAFKEKLLSAEGKLYVDCGFYGGLVPGNTHEIKPLIDAGVLGVKAFLIHSGIDDFPNVSETDLRAAMPIIAQHGVPLLVHCELSSSNLKSHITNPRSYLQYLSSRPRQWEHEAIELMILLCKEYSCKVHIVHVSSSDAIPLLNKARASGLPLTTETCPHYLYFTAEEIPDGDTRFKCAPPIRGKENRERLWNALRNGAIDFIVSDHSPSVPSLKCLETGNFTHAWGGIASLQFGLSIVWTEARKRGCSVSDLGKWMAQRPAEFVGLRKKGRIAPGYDADVVIWDPDATMTVQPSMIVHRHKLTPYEGRTLYGNIVKTYLRGTMVFDNGSFVQKPLGNILLRKNS
ncbi:MAG: allantoinase AllB [Ignavibacteria bacterium]|nr:allantoinase AllB [Ignavibacteria bacterium]MBI3765381.1 allantoinase AllB [Ignavibacteriales bacterium]